MAEKKGKCSLWEHPIAKLQSGDALWDDDFVEAMAKGEKPKSYDIDKIIVPIKKRVASPAKKESPDKENLKPVVVPKKMKTANLKDDGMYEEEDISKNEFTSNITAGKTGFLDECPLQKYIDAEYDSDGEKIIEKKYTPVKEHPELPPKKGAEFVNNSEDFRLSDYEGEEEPPKPAPPGACPHCRRSPCIVIDQDSCDEGHEIIDDMINDENEYENNNYRYALYRMYARQLRMTIRTILPRCVYNFVQKSFPEDNEEYTGFKERE